MRRFAEIDQANMVLRVIVVGDDQENAEEYLSNGFGGKWVESSPDSESKKMANIGYRYRQDADGFQPPIPFQSWSFNEKSWQWEPPVPMPADSKPYFWNEDSGAWEAME